MLTTAVSDDLAVGMEVVFIRLRIEGEFGVFEIECVIGTRMDGALTVVHTIVVLLSGSSLFDLLT